MFWIVLPFSDRKKRKNNIMRLRSLIFTLLTITALFSSGENSHTHSWWVDGYPYSNHRNKQEDCRPWRITQTNAYTLVFDTAKLTIPHFGVLQRPYTYEQSGHHTQHEWAQLSSADLKLEYTLDGERFTATSASIPVYTEDWQRGPRLIEAGRYWQRQDVWKLIFTNTKGEKLQKNARIEIGTWSRNLTMSFILEEPAGEGELSLTFKTNKNTWANTAPINSGQGEVTILLELDGKQFKQTAENNIAVSTNAKSAYNPKFQANVIDISSVKAKKLPENATPNDLLVEIPFSITNNSTSDENARLVLEHPIGKSLQQKFGVPITGISAILCDKDGRPTGIPVQLSKNWHSKKEMKIPFEGQWFRGFTNIPLKAGETLSYKIRFFHGHWGKLPAASHSQLCLIGWGLNQIWEESALGAWGETFCYEPTRGHRDSIITDIRPLLIDSYSKKPKYSWTRNVGGGDFFVFEHTPNKRIPTNNLKSTYLAAGPCLTDVFYTATLGDNLAKYEIRSGLGRTNDMARVTYRIKFKVLKDFNFTRGVLFQFGGDHYNNPLEAKMAYGDTTGAATEWLSTNEVMSTKRHKLSNITPWVSLHDTRLLENDKKTGGMATRGFVIREWKATLGGKNSPAYLQQKNSNNLKLPLMQAEVVLPPGTNSLKKGDYIEATIEYLIPPKTSNVYYGENIEFKENLSKFANRWQIIARDAVLHEQKVQIKKGTLVQRYPDIKVKADQGNAQFIVRGKQYRYTPVTVSNLKSATQGQIFVDGKPLDQSLYGEDYYQTEFNAATGTWSKTYNIKFSGPDTHTVTFQ